MKTTINISDSLFSEAWKIAEKNGTTFREVIEKALRLFLKKGAKKEKPFKLKICSFRGNGLVDDLPEWDWEEIRRRAYEGRGG